MQALQRASSSASDAFQAQRQAEQLRQRPWVTLALPCPAITSRSRATEPGLQVPGALHMQMWRATGTGQSSLHTRKALFGWLCQQHGCCSDMRPPALGFGQAFLLTLLLTLGGLRRRSECSAAVI